MAYDLPFSLGVEENEFRPVEIFWCDDFVTNYFTGLCVLHVSPDGHQVLFFFAEGDGTPAFFVLRTPEQIIITQWLIGLPL